MILDDDLRRQIAEEEQKRYEQERRDREREEQERRDREINRIREQLAQELATQYGLVRY